MGRFPFRHFPHDTNSLFGKQRIGRFHNLYTIERTILFNEETYDDFALRLVGSIAFGVFYMLLKPLHARFVATRELCIFEIINK